MLEPKVPELQGYLQKSQTVLRGQSYGPGRARWFFAVWATPPFRNDLSMHAFQKLALAKLAGWGRSFGRCLSRILFHPLCISVLRQFLCMARLWSRASFSLCWKSLSGEVETKVSIEDNSPHGALLRTLVSRCPTFGSLLPGLDVAEMSETWWDLADRKSVSRSWVLRSEGFLYQNSKVSLMEALMAEKDWSFDGMWPWIQILVCCTVLWHGKINERHRFWPIPMFWVSTLLRGRVLSPFFRFCVFFLSLWLWTGWGGWGGVGGDVNVLCDCKVLLHFHTYVMLRYC